MRKAAIILVILLWPAVCLPAFDKNYIGVNYSPYHGGSYGPAYEKNPKLWGSYTQQDIDNDLKLIAHNFNYIRTYTVQYNQKYIVSIAAKYNIKVALGAHLWQPVDDPLYNKGHNYDQAKAWAESHIYPELDEVIREANAYPGTVKCILVGNEWVGRQADGFLTPPDGIKYMAYVRGKLTGAAKTIPVTTSERWAVLAGSDQATKNLVAATDQFVFANIYPFWDGAKIANWQAQFLADYKALKTAIGTKGIVVGETGWPTGVEPPKFPHLTDTPNIPNQKRYIQEYTQWAIDNRVTSFLFEMFDEPWKWHEGQNAPDKDGVGDHWGLYDTGSRPKWLGTLSGPASNSLLLGQ